MRGEHSRMYKSYWYWLLPIIAFGVFTLWSKPWDLAVASYFHSHPEWGNSGWASFAFDYGIYPAWFVVIVAATVLILSYSNDRMIPYRRDAIFLLLTLAIGAGLLTHAMLKDHWGRPRPRQTIEFGGNQPFRAYYEPYFSNPEPSKSFPCGHCSMGFFFFSVAILGATYRDRGLYLTGMVLAWGLGIFLGIARMAQEGHFLSDVAASALLLWLTSLGLGYLLYKDNA